MAYTLTNNDVKFIHAVLDRLENKTSENKRTIEKLAATFGIENKNLVKELTEYAIVIRARMYASQLRSGGNIETIYQQIVSLYQNQVNLSHRTSQSILLQQYSTPAPIAFVAGVYAGLPVADLTGKPFDPSAKVFEPSAGNGLLTIAAPEYSCHVNEIDHIRSGILEDQNYDKVTNLDASEPFPMTYQVPGYASVITNPPFARLPETIVITDADGIKWQIKDLDHYMAINALNCMRNNGKAAIIIGGHTKYDSRGRVQAGKNRTFLSYLYKHYHVDDVIPIDGKKLYSRQGTAFNTRLILINGRREKPGGYVPLNQHDIIVSDFDHLFSRVVGYHTVENAKTHADPQETLMAHLLKISNSPAFLPNLINLEIKHFSSYEKT